MPGQLAAIIRAKHPGAYDDMDDATLEKSVLAKYPQYADLAKDDAPRSAPVAPTDIRATPFGNSMAIRARGGVLNDGPAEKPSFMTSLGNDAMESMAHPQSGLDFAGLIGAPVDATRAIGTKLAGRIVSAIPARTIANKTLHGAAAVMESPLANFVSPRLQHLGKLADALADTIGTTASHAEAVAARTAATEANAVMSQVAHGADQFHMPRATETVVERAPRAAQTFSPPPQPKPMRGRLRTTTAPEPTAAPAGQQMPPVAQPAPTATQAPAAVTTQPMVAAPAQAAPEAAQELPAAWKALAEQSPELRQPRVDIGAEKVGRAAGMTKEEVRMQTGPILGETLGEASPILPEKALQRIIDTLKQLPKGGTEREAYVAKATSGKAQWQIENIRRTLEHLGLLVAGPAVGVTLRDALADRMRQSQQ